jgi:hypothetical protein
MRAATVPAKPARPKKQAAYMLPIDLIRAIKARAAAEDCYPAEVVRQAMADHLDRNRKAEGRKATTA